MPEDIEPNTEKAEIARLSDRLAQSLAREAAQRQRNEELRDRNRQLSEFTQMVSHDLRAPLRQVVALTGFLREDADDQVLAAVEGRLGQIEQRVRAMIGLIEDMHDHALAGAASGRPTAADLQTLATEAVGLISETAGIDISLHCDLGIVTTDTTPLSICLRNLIDNAVKHHPGPTGTVTVEARADDDHLVITVVDDGDGIDPVHHDRVFEPRRSLSGGTGLGLSTVVRILSDRGGSIALDSDVGQGATFTVNWPLRAEPVVDLAATPPRLVTTTAAGAVAATGDHPE